MIKLLLFLSIFSASVAQACTEYNDLEYAQTREDFDSTFAGRYQLVSDEEAQTGKFFQRSKGECPFFIQINESLNNKLSYTSEGQSFDYSFHCGENEGERGGTSYIKEVQVGNSKLIATSEFKDYSNVTETFMIFYQLKIEKLKSGFYKIKYNRSLPSPLTGQSSRCYYRKVNSTN